MVKEVITTHRIHVRRITNADSKTRERRDALCPMQGQYVDVDSCKSCPRLFAVNRSNEGAFLMCRVPRELARGDERRMPTLRGDRQTSAPPVGEIMTKDVLCVTPDTSVERLLSLLLERSFSGAPVVDKDDKPVGMVTRSDLVELLEDRVLITGVPISVRTPEGLEYELGPGFERDELVATTVDEIMSPIVFAVHAETSVTQAAALMAFEGVHRVPVLDDTGKLMGIVSAIDVMRWVGREAGYVLPHGTERQRNNCA